MTCDAPPAPPLPEVALVDDAPFYRFAWSKKLAGRASVRAFPTPDAFWCAASADGALLARLALVVTDLRFDDGDETGCTFARALRRAAPHVAVVLSTHAMTSAAEMQGLFDAVIAKEAVDWPTLAPLVARAGSDRR